MVGARFSDDDGMDFAVRCVLSGVGYGMADPGEVLATAARVPGGDVDAWFDEWTALGARCDAIADEAAAAGHRESAAQAYLRAANYRFAGFYYVLATASPARRDQAWAAHRRSVGSAFAHWSTPIEPFSVGWDGGAELRAWRFRAPGPTDERRPLMVLHNGLASPLSDVMMTGAVDAVARGWDLVAFDGPGQGHARFVDGLGPVDDWERVGAAVLDAALAGSAPAPTTVVAAGISDGGYLAARHAAGDDRVDALVCDPGVLRPIDGVVGGLPEALASAWAEGGGAAVDRAAEAATDPDTAFAAAKAVEQWPDASVGAVLDRLAGWDLAPLVDRLPAPVLVCDPDDAMSFPGQSAELVGLLGERARRLVFTTEEGAGLDCEIGAPRLRNQRVFDLLDEIARTTRRPTREDHP